MNEEYQSILNDYRILNDSDLGFAFDICKRATVLKDTLGEQVTNNEKLMLDAKHNSEAVKARVSSSVNSVASGDRIAKQSKEYSESVHRFTLLNKQYEYSKIQLSVLKDIGFQCFSIYNDANKRVKGE